MKALKKLTIGITSIAEILQNDYLYVDKTAYIHKLITHPPYQSLYRPRHFGKSLLCSTIGEIFRGNKELFKGCHIYNTDYKWEERPVIQLDFADIQVTSVEELAKALTEKLHAIAASYKVSLDADDPRNALIDLIETLSQKARVAVLVEGYDKPVMDNLGNQEQAKMMQEELMDTLGLIKSLSSHIKFALIQAECRVALVNMFSGLNNLYDITHHEEYASLLGYTEEEIRHNFAPHLEILSEKQKRPVEQILQELRLNYNGYCFSSGKTSVYNPHDVLSFFQTGEIGSYTPIPSFFKTLIQKKGAYSHLEGGSASSFSMGPQEPQSMNLFSSTLQTGYYTFRGLEPEHRYYHIDYPNPRVKKEFLSHFFQVVTGLSAEKHHQAGENLAQALHGQDWESFFKESNALLLLTPRERWEEKEYPHRAFFALSRLLLMNTQEKITSKTSYIEEDGSFHIVFIGENALYFIQFSIDAFPEKPLSSLKERLLREHPQEKKSFLLEARIECKTQSITSWKLLSG